jgi:plastocyanin
MGRRILLPAALLAAVVLSGGALLAAQGEVAEIHIDNFAFGPAEVTVAPGTRIIWTNRDDIPHTVTDAGEPRGFKSAPLDTGDSFSHVFPLPGTYRYFCSLHPHMQATVVVK